MGLEAMGMGVCCVLSHTGAEYAQDGVNSLLFTPGNADQAIQCIDLLLTDETLRGKLVHAGWETAHTAANSEPFITAFDAALKAVLND